MNTRFRSKFAGFAVLTLACSFFYSASAQAFTIGATVGPNFITTNGVSNGFESGLYLGSKMNLGLDFQPEALVTYTTIGRDSGSRLMGGARLMLPGMLQPGVYGHLGYAAIGSGTGFTWDAGGLLDFSLGFFQAGVHVGYAMMDTNPVSISWVNVGAHAQFNF